MVTDFSEQLLLARAKMDWTQKDLANYLGVGSTTLWRWETAGDMPHKKTIVQVKMKLKELDKQN